MASKLLNFFRRRDEDTPSDTRAQASSPPPPPLELVSESLGLPHNPRCLAFDPVQSLLAVGADGGLVRIFGQAGVTYDITITTLENIVALSFVPNKGMIVCVLDSALQLWDFTTMPATLTHTLAFKREKLVCLMQPVDSAFAYLGTERGNLFVLRSGNLTRCEYEIMWDRVTNIDDRSHPGQLVCISPSPGDGSKLLLGYSQGLLVTWDLTAKNVEWRFNKAHLSRLRAAEWTPDGKGVVTVQANGAILKWNGKNQSAPESEIRQFDPVDMALSAEVANAAIAFRKNEPIIVCDGGPAPLDGRSYPLTVARPATARTMLFNSEIKDIVLLGAAFSAESTAALILTQTHIEFIDFAVGGGAGVGPGRAAASTHALDIEKSPVTCSRLVAVPTSKLASLRQMFSRHCLPGPPFPVNGGVRKLASEASGPALAVTGHEDGTVRIWDVEQDFALLCLLQPPGVDSPAVPSAENEWVMSVTLSLDGPMTLFVVHSAGGVLCYRFSATPSSNCTVQVLTAVLTVADNAKEQKPEKSAEAKVAADRTKLSQLKDLGFSEEDSLKALSECDNNVNAAAALLFEKSMEEIATDAAKDPKKTSESPTAPQITLAPRQTSYNAPAGFQLVTTLNIVTSSPSAPQTVVDYITGAHYASNPDLLAIAVPQGAVLLEAAIRGPPVPRALSIHQLLQWKSSSRRKRDRDTPLSPTDAVVTTIAPFSSSDGVAVAVGTSEGDVFIVRSNGAELDIGTLLTLKTTRPVIGLIPLGEDKRPLVSIVSSVFASAAGSRATLSPIDSVDSRIVLGPAISIPVTEQGRVAVVDVPSLIGATQEETTQRCAQALNACTTIPELEAFARRMRSDIVEAKLLPEPILASLRSQYFARVSALEAAKPPTAASGPGSSTENASVVTPAAAAATTTAAPAKGPNVTGTLTGPGNVVSTAAAPVVVSTTPTPVAVSTPPLDRKEKDKKGSVSSIGSALAVAALGPALAVGRSPSPSPEKKREEGGAVEPTPSTTTGPLATPPQPTGPAAPAASASVVPTPTPTPTSTATASLSQADAAAGVAGPAISVGPPYWLVATEKEVRVVGADSSTVSSWTAPGKGKTASALYAMESLDVAGEVLVGVLTHRGVLFVLDMSDARPNVVELPLPVRPQFRVLRKIALSTTGMLLLFDEEITLSRLLRPLPPGPAPALAATGSGAAVSKATAQSAVPTSGAAAAGTAAAAPGGSEAAASIEQTTNQLFRPSLPLPDRPSQGLLKGLLSGASGASPAAREALFAGLEKKQDNGVVRTDHRAPNALDQLRQRMNERAERLQKFEDQSELMDKDAAQFSENASALVDYYKNKKWWQL